MRISTELQRVLFVAVLVALCCALISSWAFDFKAFENDDSIYHFHAKLLTHGKLSEEAISPDNVSTRPTAYFFSKNGNKWFGPYTIGNSAMLALGELLGSPFVTPLVLTALLLIIYFYLLKDIFDSRMAMLALVLLAFSPALIGMGSVLHSESTDRFFLAVFLLTFLKWIDLRSIETSSWQRSIFFPACSGSALGLSFNTRPQVAVIFGVACGLYGLFSLYKTESRRRLVRRGLVFLLFAALFSSFVLVQNYRLKGDPLMSVHPDRDRYGFQDYFRPQDAFNRLWRRLLPAMAYNMTGWGYIDPEPFLPYMPFSRYSNSGIKIFSSSGEEELVLKVAGNEAGEMSVQFYDKTRSHMFIQRSPFSCCGYGRGTVQLRLKRDDDLFTAFYRYPDSAEWKTAGQVRVKLEEYFQLALVTNLSHPEGRVRSLFKYFKVHNSSDATFAGSNFANPGKDLQRRWREVLRTSGADVNWIKGKGLELRAETSDKPSFPKVRLARTVSATAFDLEFELYSNWRDFRLAPDTQEEWLEMITDIILILLTLSTFFFMLIPLFHHSRTCYDVLFISILGLNLIFFFFYFGSSWDGTLLPHRTRYYNETMLLCGLPLVARGLLICYDYLCRIVPVRLALFAGGVIVAGGLTNSLYSNFRMAESYRQFAYNFERPRGVIRWLPKLVKEKKLDNAVVFIKVNPQASIKPLGDLPFDKSDRTGVVYLWLKSGENWQDIRDSYFPGRQAFLYAESKLQLLQAEK